MKQPHTEQSVEHTENEQNTGNQLGRDAVRQFRDADGYQGERPQVPYVVYRQHVDVAEKQKSSDANEENRKNQTRPWGASAAASPYKCAIRSGVIGTSWLVDG